MPSIYSTHSTDLAYSRYRPDTLKDPNVLPQVERSITIKGGAGVMTKKFVTPGAVRTEVSDEDLAYLMSDPHFLRHIKAGYLVIEGVKVDPDVVGADMKHGDGSEPSTPGSFEEGKGPVSGGDDEQRPARSRRNRNSEE